MLLMHGVTMKLDFVISLFHPTMAAQTTSETEFFLNKNEANKIVTSIM